MTKPLVFVSYSRQDVTEKEHLLTHLRVLQHAGHIETWSDDRISAGADWEHEITQAMAQARVAILLVTASFLTSDFVLGTEIPTFLERQQQQGLLIYPIIAKACAWQKVPWLARLNVRLFGSRPVWGDGGSHVDEDLARIVQEIAELLQTARPAVTTPPGEVRFSLVAPTGERYETAASPDTLVAELQSTFLQEWQPATEAGSVSYAIRHTPHHGDLEPTATLAKTGIGDGATLYLIQKRLSPTEPVRLTIEDLHGHSYITAVRLDTSVGRLAQAFLETTATAGEATVELLPETLAVSQPRRLRPEVTLYDERVHDGARLRIVPALSRSQTA